MIIFFCKHRIRALVLHGNSLPMDGLDAGKWIIYVHRCTADAAHGKISFRFTSKQLKSFLFFLFNSDCVFVVRFINFCVFAFLFFLLPILLLYFVHSFIHSMKRVCGTHRRKHRTFHVHNINIKLFSYIYIYIMRFTFAGLHTIARR